MNENVSTFIETGIRNIAGSFSKKKLKQEAKFYQYFYPLKKNHLSFQSYFDHDNNNRWGGIIKTKGMNPVRSGNKQES